MIYYAVRIGRKPGIYTDWAKCFLCISGYKNAVFKKFNTKQDAIGYMNSHNSVIDLHKKTVTKDTHYQPIHSTTKNPMYIYTDGSCINNGYKNAKAGIGVYFGKDDNRNISDKFTTRPSNQRAELYAIIRAILLLTPTEIKTKKIIIYTDSMYSINCVGRWCKNWIKNGWKTKNKKDVKNQDLIKTLYILAKKNRVNLTHIKAHTGKNDIHSIGNSVADKLALAGALS